MRPSRGGEGWVDGGGVGGSLVTIGGRAVVRDAIVRRRDGL